MADATATLRVDLQDGTSGPAAQAAGALRQLQAQIKADSAALAQLEKAFRQMNSAQVVNVAAARQLKDAIAAKKQAIADAQAAVVGLGGHLRALPKDSSGASSAFARFAAASGQLPGPLGGVTSQLGSLSGLLKSGGLVLGIVAVTAAVVALTAAVIGAAAALLKYGLAQADARRSELLRLEGLTKLRNWYGLAAGNASDLQSATDKVAATVAISRGEVAKFTEQLYRAGLRGQNLETALEGVAIKAAVQGDAAAKSFAGWAAGTALAGGSVRKLTDDVKARLGGIAARQMLSLEVQTNKLRESFSALFSGLRLEPLLRGLQSVTELFTQNTASGRALKHLMEFLLQPVIDASETAGLYVRRFFQGFVIAALKTEIVILRLRLWFKETLGTDLLGKLDLTKVAVYAGAAAFAALAAAVTLLVIPVGVMLTVFAALGGIVAGAAYLVRQLYLGVRFLASAFVEALPAIQVFVLDAWDVIKSFFGRDWLALGRSIVDGIVGGLKSGASALLEAMTGLAVSAYKAFKSALGIASPSKEFAKLGVTLPQGVAQGVDRGAPEAQAAVASMVQVPESSASSASPASPAPAPRGRTAPSLSVTIESLNVQSSAPDQRGLLDDFEAALKVRLQAILEDVAVQLGGAVS